MIKEFKSGLSCSAILSATVGIPSGRVAPVSPFGMSTRRTGGGK